MKILKLVGTLGCFLGMYGLILIYALIFNNQAGWTLWVFVTLFLLVEVLCMLGSLSRLTILAPDTTFLENGKQAILQFQLKSIGSYPLFFIHLQLSCQQFSSFSEWFFYTNSEKTLAVTWIPNKRGHYTTIDFQLTSRDLFGWIQKKQTIKVPFNFIVLPKVNTQAQQLLIYLKSRLSQHNFGESDYTIRSYRQYRIGDEIKQIDWKQTGRQQEVILREYQVQQEVEPFILFWGQESLYFEDTLSLFYSLFKLWELKPQRVLLFGDGINQSEISLSEKFAKIAPFSQKATLPPLVGKYILVFAPEQSKQLTEALVQLKAKNQVEIYTQQQLLGLLQKRGD